MQSDQPLITFISCIDLYKILLLSYTSTVDMCVIAHCAHRVTTRVYSILFLKLKHYCQGLTKSVKFQRKDQSVKKKCLFLLLWPISCISLVFLIEILSFCSNLLKNYPVHKIDHLPHLRILSLCMDHSMPTRINSLYPFLLFLFTPPGSAWPE